MKRLVMVAMVVIATALPTFAARAVVVGGGRFGAAYGPYGWYGPYDGFYPYGAFPNAGYVKLDTPVKNANVYIDGSLAGTVKQLHTITLLAGKYTVQISAPGRETFQQNIFVAPGKTIKLHPDLKQL